MKIWDNIRRFFAAGTVLDWGRTFGAGSWWRGWNDWDVCRYKFAEVIWYNICDLLTDLIEDVLLTDKSGANPFSEEGRKFEAFKAFMYAWGKSILQKLYDDGFVVIAYDEAYVRFWALDESEFIRVTVDGVTIPKLKEKGLRTFVMKSATYIMYGHSDKDLCRGFLNFIDDVLNGSATVSKRLGAVVVASPKNLNSAPTSTILTDDQKKKLEEDMRKDYGALSNQSNIMLLPREMSWQTINLAGLDLKMQEKVKTAILAIVDRIKIPANQVAIIDAQSSKSLANGGEIREGDKLKYKSFQRLFERTFADMARYYGLQIGYVIDGEPIGQAAEVTV